MLCDYQIVYRAHITSRGHSFHAVTSLLEIHRLMSAEMNVIKMWWEHRRGTLRKSGKASLRR